MRKSVPLFAGLLLSFITTYGQWTTSGANIYNSNTGVVGIGTGASFSGFKLEVVGNGQILRNTTSTSYTSLRLYNNQNLAARALEIDYSGSSFTTPLLSGGPTGEAGSITTTGGYPLLFGTGNALRMIINSSGNVGIGTNNPTNRLEVAGTSFNRISAIVTSDVQNGFQAKKLGTNATDWEMYIPSGSTSLRFYNASFGDLMNLNTNGNIGIGTTGPVAKLHIVGPVTGDGASLYVAGGGDVLLGSGGSIFFDNNYSYASGSYLRPVASNTQGFFTSGAERMRITPGGYIGVGTSSPSSLFSISSSIERETLRLYKNGNTTNYLSLWQGTGAAALDPIGTGMIYIGYDQPTRVILGRGGKVGIGTDNPDYLLTVNGTIHAKEVRVDLSVPGPDYVFDKGYKLLSLADVRTYIEKHHHLPDVPSAGEMEKNGVRVSEMNMLLLRKVEELTLYVLQLEEKIMKSERDK